MGRFVPVHTGSPRFDSVEIAGFRITDAWFPPDLVLPPHEHEWAIFAVMLEGSFQVGFRQRAFDCPPSGVWTEPAGERHGNRVEQAGARVVVVQPDPAREEDLRPCRDILDSINNFRHERIASLARRLAVELAAPDVASPLAMEATVLEMLAAAARLEERKRRGGEPPAYVVRARDLIQDRFSESLRIADVAAAVDVQPMRLASGFRAHYHTSIGSYVRQRRVEWAAERLIGSQDSLATIALKAGYTDQSHFTRAFKRQTGLTPGRYRTLRSDG